MREDLAPWHFLVPDITRIISVSQAFILYESYLKGNYNKRAVKIQFPRGVLNAFYDY